MRIGLNGAFWGMPHTGSGQYTHHLLHALADAGCDDLHLCLPSSALDRAETAMPEQAPWRTAVRRTTLDRVHSDLAKLWFEQVAWPRWCRGMGLDIAHVPYFAPPLLTGVPTVVTIHDLIPLLLPAYRGGPHVRAYMRLVARAARHAALILTDSEASRRDILRLLGVSAERVRVTYLAADASYRPLNAKACALVLKRLGLPERYLLYLGGFDCRKNVPVLLAAYARAHEHLGAPLVIAGRLPREDTAFTPDPRRVACELDLGDSRVHFTGWIDEADKPALYSGALAFLFPSRYEGFGLPVLEALACGTPAVVGGGSSLDEIAGPGGIVVPPDDVDALAAGLVEVATNEARRAALAQAGLAHAATFSWQRTARETLVAYGEALELGRHA